MKKVLVTSFQRSGTHFLMNTMATNFIDIEDGWVDVVHAKDNRWVKDVNRFNLKEKIREHMIEKYYFHPMRKCMKTHFQMYFFERHLGSILEKYDILYIVRDPRDTMVACFHYYNRTNYEAFIKESSFSQFLRTELWNVRTETQPFSYSLVKPKNIIDKWNKHVLSWLHYKDKGVIFVRFNDLKQSFENTLSHIQQSTSQKLKEDLTPVGIDDVRYRPDFEAQGLKRGGLGIWRDYFTEEDSEFLRHSVSDQTRQFFDE